MKCLLEHDGLVEYYPRFLTPTESENYFKALEAEIDWQSDQLIMFGKHITTKRKVAWYGDQTYEYIYSNNTKIAKPWTRSLSIIRDQLQAYTGESFNSCLLNFYHDGSEGMGWHSDDEIMMQRHAPIASISLGAERTFIFRHKISKEQHAIELENGSLLLMKGATQDYWKHQLPIRKRVKAPRVNLTFRQFNSPFDTYHHP
tara:strand:+ start:21404 stop:22006 length:603 start_codon:yes stop_codon:yes gene_type:complete